MHDKKDVVRDETASLPWLNRNKRVYVDGKLVWLYKNQRVTLSKDLCIFLNLKMTKTFFAYLEFHAGNLLPWQSTKKSKIAGKAKHAHNPPFSLDSITIPLKTMWLFSTVLSTTAIPMVAKEFFLFLFF